MGTPNPGAAAAGGMVARAAMRRGVEKSLHDGEELLAFRGLRRFAAIRRYMWPCLLVEPPLPELPTKLALAVTGQRLLVFECGGIANEVKGIVIDIPRGEVRDVQDGGRQISWAAQGRRYTINLGGREAEQIAAAIRSA